MSFQGSTIFRAMVFGLCVVAMRSSAVCQEQGLLSPRDTDATEAEFPDLKPVAISDKDTQLQKLLKTRCNTAIEEVTATSNLFRGGRLSLDSNSDAMADLTKAGLELAESLADQIAQRETAFKYAAVVESIVKSKFEAQAESFHTMKSATFQRLDAENELLKAREAEKRRTAKSR